MSRGSRAAHDLRGALRHGDPAGATAQAQTRPRSRSACRWSSAGSWPGCAIRSSSRWPRSTMPSPSCWSTSTCDRSRSSRALDASGSRRSIGLHCGPCRQPSSSLVQAAQGQYRLPRRHRRPLLQRAARAGAQDRRARITDTRWRSCTSASASPAMRASKSRRHTTVAEHMPAAHRAHLEWTPERFHRWAAESDRRPTVGRASADDRRTRRWAIAVAGPAVAARVASPRWRPPVPAPSPSVAHAQVGPLDPAGRADHQPLRSRKRPRLDQSDARRPARRDVLPPTRH